MNNIEVLDKVAAVLVEKENIDGDELQQIVAASKAQQYLKKDAPGERRAASQPAQHVACALGWAHSPRTTWPASICCMAKRPMLASRAGGVLCSFSECCVCVLLGAWCPCLPVRCVA